VTLHNKYTRTLTFQIFFCCQGKQDKAKSSNPSSCTLPTCTACRAPARPHCMVFFFVLFFIFFVLADVHRMSRAGETALHGLFLCSFFLFFCTLPTCTACRAPVRPLCMVFFLFFHFSSYLYIQGTVCVCRVCRVCVVCVSCVCTHIYMHTHTGAALTGSEKGVRVLLKAGSNPNFSTPSQDIHLFFLFFLKFSS
jgi:hypothetical protein